MKVIRIKKSIVFFSILIVFICTFSLFNICFGMQHYYKLDFSTGLVTASALNVRSGPGIGYNVITTVKKNEYIRIFAGVGDWYIVQVEGDYIGAVSKKYVKPIYANSNASDKGNNNNTSTDSTLTSDEKEVFDLINKERTSRGLSALKIDNELQKVARIKAQDMVNNNYFSHTSPTYGSPFDMMKKFNISYKSAGENIAGNSNNKSAVVAWMNSTGHRENILNSSYNYTGIGVINGSKYGKIYVQMFIGK